MTFSISYMATKNDNGHCLTFWTRSEADAARAALIAGGCYHVSQVW